MNYIRNLIYGRDEFSPKVKTLLKHFGQQPIKQITICRNPLHTITTITKLFSKVPYEKLYHLYLKIVLESGHVLILEKNEQINMDIFRGFKKGTETHDIQTPINNLTIDIMLAKTKEVMGNNFFKYQAGNNNCQTFIYNLVKCNGLLFPDVEQFIVQKTKEIFEQKPTLRKFTNTLTDIAGRLDVIKQGGSESLNQHNGLTDTRIQHILGKHLNKIFMKDEIPTKLHTGWYIMNMDDSTDKRNGTHWVAFFFKNRRIFTLTP